MHSVTSNAVSNYLMSGNNANPINDCNLATRNGIWYFANAQNCPPASLGFNASDNSGSLYVQAYDSSWINQICQDYYGEGAVYVRSCKLGIWGDWSRLNQSSGWSIIINFNPSSYIAGKIESGFKILHLHFQSYAFAEGTLSIGYTIANLPSDWRPNQIDGVRRCVITIDLISNGVGVGRVPADIDIVSDGNLNLYPMFINQYSGMIPYGCILYGDVFITID